MESSWKSRSKSSAQRIEQYVRTHQANLKKADDNPFKEKNAAEIEKLQAKLEETQRQAERNAQAANENADKARELERKLNDTQRQVREMGQQLTDQLNSVRLRAAAARADDLLLEREFSKTDISCLEEQIRGAEKYLAVQDARLEAGIVIEVDRFEVKASLGMFKGCLAWVKGDLLQCQKEYDDAAAGARRSPISPDCSIKPAGSIGQHCSARRRRARKRNSSQAE